jgi:hypothetical protein
LTLAVAALAVAEVRRARGRCTAAVSAIAEAAGAVVSRVSTAVVVALATIILIERR